MPEQHDLRRFMLFVFALLVPSFALWTAVSAQLAMPAVELVRIILTNWFPDVVYTLYPEGAEVLVFSEYGELNGNLVAPEEADFRLGFKVNTRILSYSIPFYTALHFATRQQVSLGKYALGLFILYCLLVVGLLCLCLKELMVTLGTTFLEQPGVFVPGADVIGMLYQFSVLMVPTLVPVILWVWQNRDTPLLRRAFNLSGKPADGGKTPRNSFSSKRQ